MPSDEANWNTRIAKESSTPRVVELSKSPDAVVVAIPLPAAVRGADPLAILTPAGYPQARCTALKE